MKPGFTEILAWIRWPNLVIVVLTLFLIRYTVILPALSEAGLALSLNTFSFIILCLITVLVTISGYVINDYFDRETDRINKPDKLAIGVWISPGKAMGVYLAMVVLGGMLSLYLAVKHDSLRHYWVYPASVGMLWVYSYTLKSTVLWGNFVVSVFCAAVALLLPFTEMEAIRRYPGPIMELLVFYAVFAGLSNMIREIVKDAEDVVGDRVSGVTTLATRYGENTSRILAILFCCLLAAGLAWFLTSGYIESRLAYGLVTGIPLITLLILLLAERKDTNWKRLSRLTKLLMLAGLVAILFLR